jgi:maltose alpha-D-glucosyltransferase/alpha-amylase
VPIELAGGAAFPPIGDLPYMLTLPAYGFFWFLLAGEVDAPRWHTPAPDPLPEFVTLTVPGGRLDRALQGHEREHIERYALPEFLARQRWFAGKGETIRSVGITPVGAIPGQPNQLALLEAAGTGEEQRYFMPLSVLWGEDNLRFGAPKLSYTLAKVRHGPNLGALLDGSYDERFLRDLVNAMQRGSDVPAEGGTLRFHATEAFRSMELAGEVRPVGAEQSNVSLIVGDAAMVKIYRRVRRGEQPEIEVARFLTETAGFANTPAFLGSAEYVPADGEAMAFAAAFAFVRNQGDAWGVILDALDRNLDEFALLAHDDAGLAPGAMPGFTHPLDLAVTLGRRTAELHAAFATPTDDPAFAAETIGGEDVGRWVDAAIAEGEAAFARLERTAASLPEEARAEVAALLAARATVFDRLEAARRLGGSAGGSGLKTRIHGDYHLGQVLVAQDDVMIIDFEGEPQRDISERREKSSPLRDVAGMLRSFDYATYSSLDRLRTRHGNVEPHVRARALAWRDSAAQTFLNGYWPRAARAGLLPEDSEARRHLLEIFLFGKAFYEISYEAANRPAWISIPVRGVLDLIAPRESTS